MKLAIIGSGAVGGMVGGLLSESKRDVLIFGRQEFIDSVNSNGLKFTGVDGTKIMIFPCMTDDLSRISEADAIFLCVKSQDTADACLGIRDYIKPESIVFSLQNGVRNAEIINSVLTNKVVRTVVMFNTISLKPGEILQASEGPLIVEDIPYVHDIIDYINEPLKRVGAEVNYEDNIEGVLWSKLLLNQMNSIGAATNSQNRSLFIDPVLGSISRECMEEGKMIVENSGIHLKGMGDKSIEGMIKLMSMPLKDKEIIVTQMFKIDGAVSSTLQSVLRGKATEIDYLNGEVVRLASKTGQRAPINEALVKAVKDVEQSGLKGNLKFYSKDELKELIDRYKRILCR